MYQKDTRGTVFRLSGNMALGGGSNLPQSNSKYLQNNQYQDEMMKAKDSLRLLK
jgi:hypothetical protein